MCHSCVAIISLHGAGDGSAAVLLLLQVLVMLVLVVLVLLVVVLLLRVLRVPWPNLQRQQYILHSTHHVHDSTFFLYCGHLVSTLLASRLAV